MLSFCVSWNCVLSSGIVVVVIGIGFGIGRWSNLGGGPAGGSRKFGGIHPSFGLGFMIVGVLVEVVFVVVSTSCGGEASDMPSQGLSMGLLSATSEGLQELSSCGFLYCFCLVVHEGRGARPRSSRLGCHIVLLLSSFGGSGCTTGAPLHEDFGVGNIAGKR